MSIIIINPNAPFLSHLFNQTLSYTCYTHSPLLNISFIFGKKTKHNVAVVDVKIIDVIIMKANVTCSESKFAKTTTLTLVMTAP